MLNASVMMNVSATIRHLCYVLVMRWQYVGDVPAIFWRLCGTMLATCWQSIGVMLVDHPNNSGGLSGCWHIICYRQHYLTCHEFAAYVAAASTVS